MADLALEHRSLLSNEKIYLFFCTNTTEYKTMYILQCYLFNPEVTKDKIHGNKRDPINVFVFLKSLVLK